MELLSSETGKRVNQLEIDSTKDAFCLTYSLTMLNFRFYDDLCY